MSAENPRKNSNCQILAIGFQVWRAFNAVQESADVVTIKTLMYKFSNEKILLWF